MDKVLSLKSSLLSQFAIALGILTITRILNHFFLYPTQDIILPTVEFFIILIGYILNKRGKYYIAAYIISFSFLVIHLLDALMGELLFSFHKIILITLSIVITTVFTNLTATTIVAISNFAIIIAQILTTTEKIHNAYYLECLIINALLFTFSMVFSNYRTKLQKATDATIYKTNTLFNTLFQNIPVALWVYNGTELAGYLKQLKQRGITDLNDYFTQNPEEIKHCISLLKITNINKTALTLFNSKDIKEFEQKTAKIFKANHIQEVKENIIHIFAGSGLHEREITYNIDGRNITVLRRIFIPKEYKENWEYIFISVIDITELKEMQKSLQQRANFLELVIGISKNITKELDIDNVLLNTVKSISKKLGFYNSSIWLVEENHLVLKAFSYSKTESGQKPEGLLEKRYPIEGIIGWAVRDNEIKYVNDVESDTHYISHIKEPRTKSECAIPLKIENKVIGVLDIQSDRVNGFSSADIEILASVADQVSIAIQNARLYNDIAKKAETMEAVNKIAKLINSELDLDAIIKRTYNILKNIFRFDAFYFALYNRENDTLEYKLVDDVDTQFVQKKAKLDDNYSSAAYVLKTKKTLNLKDVPAFIQKHAGNKFVLGKIPKTLLAVPLIINNKPIGVISIQSYKDTPFSSDQEIFLTIIAEQIAIAIQNAKLYTTLEEELEKRKQLEKQLLQAQKLEAIGRLAGGVAHEFNNLLTAIIGNTELLEIKFTSKETNPELQEIKKAAERATILTDQLLTFGKKQLITMETIDINKMIKELQESLKHILGNNIELILKLTDQPTITKADTIQITRALVNIITNAKESMLKGGKVIIETETNYFSADSKDTTPLVTTLQGNYITIKIKDTGVGIEEKNLSSIFDPFFTTKKFGDGTGLGLSIAYGIVKQLGGDITVESTTGKGTTVTIYLPLMDSNEKTNTMDEEHN